MKIYKQLSNYELKYLDTIDLNEIINNENFLKSFFSNNILIGFEKEKSFLEISINEKKSNYFIRYFYKKNEKIIDNLNFSKLSYLLKCYLNNEEENVKEFQFNKKKHKRYMSALINILYAPGILLLIALFIMMKLNVNTSLIIVLFPISILLILFGALLSWILNREINLGVFVTIKF